MKVEQQEAEFKPVVITLETQEEVDQLYAVMRFVDFEIKHPNITNELFRLLEDIQVGDKYEFKQFDKDSNILYLA